MRDWGKLIAETEVKEGDTIKELVEGALSDLAVPSNQVRAVHTNPDILPEGTSPELIARWQEFINKYHIQKLGDTQVALVLPQGISHYQFLEEAQKLAKLIFNRELINQNRLTIWSSEPNFTELNEINIELAVDGCVPNSNNKTRQVQENEGLNNVKLRGLAVAHAAFYILSGKDLFAGQGVRALGGALYFYSDGLDGVSENDVDRDDRVSASRSLPFPNSTVFIGSTSGGVETFDS